MISKLSRGNAYALKVRDNRGVVTDLYVLDPLRVTPLVAPTGDIYYRLNQDYLSALTDEQQVVPASEIIHDRFNCFFHPLVGIPPIYACGLAALQGLNIQKHSERFFYNAAKPGGILTAPGAISDETAQRLKTAFENNYGGCNNAGKIAVAGDGLKYESTAITAIDAQLIQQLEMTAGVVCSTFHVPAYMVGVGPAPTYNNVEALAQQYYAQCLQSLIEAFELCMDEGLNIPDKYGVELDVSQLLRMDTATRFKSYSDAIGAGWKAPNEARIDEGFDPVEGGDTPYLQQQNFALSDLAKRSALPNPFVIDRPAANPTPSPEGPAVDADPQQPDDAAKAQFTRIVKTALELELA